MNKLVPILKEIAGYVGGTPVSYSRAQKLLQCPLSFILKYQDRVSECGAPSIYDDAEVGKMAHKIMELSLGCAKRYGFSLDGAAFEEYFESQLRNAKTEFQHDELVRIKDSVQHSLERVLRLAAQKGTKVFTERKIHMSFDGRIVERNGMYTGPNPWKNRAFTGVVDAELMKDDKMIILDYKTEYPSEVRAEQVELQMSLYAYSEFIAYPNLNEVTTYVLYLKNAEAVKIREYKRKEFDGLEGSVIEYFSKYLNALRNLKREATPHPYCKYCGYREKYCPTLEV